MRKIMVMNAKGGCGKTTIATNIATGLADDGAKVALADFDPQGSSLDWLEARNNYEGIPEIRAINALEEPVRAEAGTDYLIIDAPAGTHGKDINDMLKRCETVIIPVMPSPIDMRACNRFLEELLHTGRISHKKNRVGIIANRVKENTLIYKDLEQYLGHLKLPFITHLRETQNYIRSSERGLGIYEMAPSMVYQDMEQWQPVFKWIKSKRSLPTG